MQRWWNKELAFLQFTKSPWWRFTIWGIALTIIAYCVSDYFVRRYDPNRILPAAPEYNSSYIPSTSLQHQEYNTQSDSVAKKDLTPSGLNPEGVKSVEDTTTEKTRWDWEGDTDTTNPVNTSLTLDELDDIELDLMNEDVERLLAKSDKVRAEVQSMLSHSIPILAEQLKAMSIDDQRRALIEMKETMTDDFPPILKKRAEENPAFVQEIWDAFMAQLQEHGFKPPN